MEPPPLLQEGPRHCSGIQDKQKQRQLNHRQPASSWRPRFKPLLQHEGHWEKTGTFPPHKTVVRTRGNLGRRMGCQQADKGQKAHPDPLRCWVILSSTPLWQRGFNGGSCPTHPKAKPPLPAKTLSSSYPSRLGKAPEGQKLPSMALGFSPVSWPSTQLLPPLGGARKAEPPPFSSDSAASPRFIPNPKGKKKCCE